MRYEGNISDTKRLLVGLTMAFSLNIHLRLVFVALLIGAACASAQTGFRNLTFSILRNPEPGYYLIEPNASDSIGFVDHSGRTVCKTFSGIHSNVQAYNNTYITHFASNTNGEPFFLRRNRFLNVIDTLRPTSAYYVDFHEGKVWSDSTYLVLASENRIMDLSGIVPGGSPSASIIGAVIQERKFSNGAVVFEWKSLDHIPVTETTDDIKLTDNLIDYIHVNSVSKDTDGNLIVSCRHLDEVIKIKKSTGEILWRLGGSASKSNQFTFVNDTFNNFTGFSHQHSAFRTAGGNIMLFDNGNLRPAPNYARAVEYALDTVTMTATRVWTWQPALGVIASSQGSVQELEGGNVLIGWGSGSDTFIAHEVRRDGTIEAEIKNETGTGMVPYRVSKMQIGLTGVRKKIASTGTHVFSSGDSATHVRVSLTRASDTTSIVVERHHYAPHAISFTGETVCGVLPLRWTLRVREPQNIAGTLVFDLGSIAEIDYPELAQIHHRPIEGQGAFTRLTGTYSDIQKTFTTASITSGEFLITYAECLEPAPVEPFNRAVEVSTTPRLTWTPAVAASAYDVQVSTSANFSPLLHAISTANLETVLPPVQESTTLYWRVRKHDANGIGPWSATSRFTVVMGIPQLLAPVMEDDTVAVQPTAEFRWIPGIGSPKSRLQITAIASGVVAVDTIIDEPTFAPGSRLRANTWYRWSVRGWADNVNGRAATAEVFITAVASPRLRGPGVNVVGVPPIKATFVWDSVPGAVSYTVMIRKSSDTALVGVYESTAPAVDVRNLPQSTKLTWTCRANGRYGPGPYATPTSFTTAASSSLPAPRTQSPRGGVAVDSNNITLVWSDVYGAKVYDLQYSLSPSFASDVVTLFDLYATQVRIPVLRSGTPYYWRVLGRSDVATGTWSDTAAFITKAAPNKGLVPLTPAVGSIDVPTQGAVTYSTSSSFTSYRVEFSKQPTFDPLISTFVSNNGTCTYTNLERATTYFWRVRGLRDGSPSEVGSASHFTTKQNDVVSVGTEDREATARVWRVGPALHVRSMDERVSHISVNVYDLQGRCVGEGTQEGSFVSMNIENVTANQLLVVVVSTNHDNQTTVLLAW